EAGSHDASASVPLVYNPRSEERRVGKESRGIADKDDEENNYTITVTNTGNISLTGVVVKDKVEGYTQTTVSGPDSGDAAPLGVLDVGEAWVYKTSYTLTQADLDADGYGTPTGGKPGDGKLDHTATATTNEAGSHDASASVPLVYNP